MTEQNLDLAMLIAALPNRPDPMTRFVESLPPDLKNHAQETIRLREEFVSHVQRMLQETPHRAPLHAEWITRHAHEVAYRWSSLKTSLERWLAMDLPVSFIVSRGTGA